MGAPLFLGTLIVMSSFSVSRAHLEAEDHRSYKMTGISMIPTLRDGQLVRVDPAAYKDHAPLRGDVVLLWMPFGWTAFGRERVRIFKRVIGLPGEKVEVRAGRVYINGRRISEKYVRYPYPASYRLRPLRLGPRGYFVLGDNRSSSYDSHVWGELPRQDIIGKALLPAEAGGKPHTGSAR
jgi:signal peptidase I